MKLVKWWRKYSSAIPFACCLVGTLLIISSLLPLDSAASKANWTETDSDEYQRITKEYKTSAFKSPGELGLTSGQFAARQKELAEAVQTMKTRLENARSRGVVWKRNLLWSGLTLTAIGLALRFSAQARGR